MPAIALGALSMATFARITRTGVVEELGQGLRARRAAPRASRPPRSSSGTCCATPPSRSSPSPRSRSPTCSPAPSSWRRCSRGPASASWPSSRSRRATSWSCRRSCCSPPSRASRSTSWRTSSTAWSIRASPPRRRPMSGAALTAELAVARPWPDGGRGAPAGLLLLFVLARRSRAPLLAPVDPARQKLLARLRPPGTRGGGITHWLGTDELGRDLLSRVIYGARVSLLVALLSVCVSGGVGHPARDARRVPRGASPRGSSCARSTWCCRSRPSCSRSSPSRCSARTPEPRAGPRLHPLAALHARRLRADAPGRPAAVHQRVPPRRRPERGASSSATCCPNILPAPSSWSPRSSSA